MPYPNQHAFRVRDPGDFQDNSFRRKSIADGIDIIIGRLKGGDSMETQAYRFDSGKWSFEDAKKWIKDHDVKPILTEEAVKKTEMTLETVHLGDVEIFETGTWKGRTYTEKELDQMVSNFESGVCEPFITIDHDDAATDLFKKLLEVGALGQVEALKRLGNKLLATFKNVPKLLGEFITSGMLKNKSIDLWKKFPMANGRIIDNVISAVTFTGKLPAINTLSDYVSLYEHGTGTDADMGEKITLALSDNERGKDAQKPTEAKMDQITISKDEYESLLKFKNDTETLKGQIETFTKNETTARAASDAQAQKIASLEKQNAELVKFKNDQEIALKAAAKTEAEGFVDGLIKEGKVLPKVRDFMVGQYLTYKNTDNFTAFKEDLASRAPVVNVNEQPEVDKEKNDESQNDGTTSYTAIDYDDMNRKVEGLMKKDKLTWEQACDKLGYMKLAKKGE